MRSGTEEPWARTGSTLAGSHVGGDLVGGDTATFDDELESLGFRVQGSSRRGGRMWVLAFNRALTFVLHDYDDRVVLSWSVAFGEILEERGWQSSVTDTSVIELYPRHDVQLPVRIEAVEAEIRRVLGSLRLDLGDPSL